MALALLTLQNFDIRSCVCPTSVLILEVPNSFSSLVPFCHVDSSPSFYLPTAITLLFRPSREGSIATSPPNKVLVRNGGGVEGEDTQLHGSSMRASIRRRRRQVIAVAAVVEDGMKILSADFLSRDVIVENSLKKLDVDEQRKGHQNFQPGPI